MKKRAFVKNAAILTATSLILRTIGIFFRIYISNKIGAEGMGLYQLIISIYVLASTFASAGLTTAVTRLVADEMVGGTLRSVRRVLRIGIALSLLLGVLSALIIFGGADLIASEWLRDLRAAPALRVLSFSLPFMGVSSCIKGYFIARRKVGSSSRAQILEQLVRIGVIALLIDRFAASGIASACFAVLLGDTIAEASSCLYLIVGCLLDRRKISVQNAKPLSQPHGLLYRILAIAAPITGGRYVNSGLRTIENVMVPETLAAYTLSKETALAGFGKLKGMALPLILFPSSFLTSFSTLLIPEISESNALRHNRQVAHTVERTLHITLLLSILLGGAFLLLGAPLGRLVYHDEEVGYMLAVLAPIAPIMYLESVVDGILKGLGQQVHSLVFSVLDSLLRIVLIVIVVPHYGMNGFLGVMVVSNLFTGFLNVRRLFRVTDARMQWGRWIARPLLAVVTAGSIAYAAGQWLLRGSSDLVYALICGSVMAGLYGLLLLLLGCIGREDFVRTVPKATSADGALETDATYHTRYAGSVLQHVHML